MGIAFKGLSTREKKSCTPQNFFEKMALFRPVVADLQLLPVLRPGSVTQSSQLMTNVVYYSFIIHHLYLSVGSFICNLFLNKECSCQWWCFVIRMLRLPTACWGEVVYWFGPKNKATLLSMMRPRT